MSWVPWCSGMKSTSTSGRLASRARRIPSVTCSRTMAAEVAGFSLSWGFRPPGWFSMKYWGLSIFPTSW